MNNIAKKVFTSLLNKPGCVAQSSSASDTKARIPGFDTRSGLLLSLPLPLVQKDSWQLLAKVNVILVNR